jgi:tRNA(Ile)-lysidine synthase TilS/MesJ
MASILLAHHEDDQAETVFMRLLNGHGVRGLRGMRGATDIPECSDLHGVYQSAVMDELDKKNPFYRWRVTRRETHRLKQSLRYDLDLEELRREQRDGYDFTAGSHPFMTGGVTDGFPKRSKRILPLESMEIEDGGIYLYRPLLEFSKERLIATCVEHKIPWFEDATNQDPTLTMRNAVRHLFSGYELPKAIQKPAVLQLAKRCQQKVAMEEAEADRLMDRMVMDHNDFEPNVGSLIVQLPDLKLPTTPFRSRYSALRRKRRKDHSRNIASILIQKLISVVAPEQTLTPISNLAWVASRLFPALAEPGEPWAPKAFTVCGVIFNPLPGEPFRWFLARAPYDTKLPIPQLKIHRARPSRHYATRPSRWRFTRWTPFTLYDNRWWVSLRVRMPFEQMIAPLEAKYLKEFKESLDDIGRSELADNLKTYAPGKVRYTLPAIYVKGNIMSLLRLGNMGSNTRHRDSEAVEGIKELEEFAKESKAATTTHPTRAGRTLPRPNVHRDRCTRKELVQMRDGELRLVALPTLGVCIPGVEKWLEWRFRYRKVDMNVVNRAMLPEEYQYRKRLERDRRKRVAGRSGKAWPSRNRRPGRRFKINK